MHKSALEAALDAVRRAAVEDRWDVGLAFWNALRRWLEVRAVHDPSPQRRAECAEAARLLAALDADVWHSALLRRLFVQGKPPLPEPPPKVNSYPVYPDSDLATEGR